jgi:hypothetical protein
MARLRWTWPLATRRSAESLSGNLPISIFTSVTALLINGPPASA